MNETESNEIKHQRVDQIIADVILKNIYLNRKSFAKFIYQV
jgi:hypothetical protein